jgi:TM2 domain-containing membrane protein YozV
MREVKSSGVAIVLSFFWTGLGQLYAGRIPRGLLMMAATPLMWFLSFVGGCGTLGTMVIASQESAVTNTASGGALSVLLAMLGFGWWIWGMVDAMNLCARHNDSLIQSGLARP